LTDFFLKFIIQIKVFINLYVKNSTDHSLAVKVIIKILKNIKEAFICPDKVQISINAKRTVRESRYFITDPDKNKNRFMPKVIQPSRKKWLPAKKNQDETVPSCRNAAKLATAKQTTVKLYNYIRYENLINNQPLPNLVYLILKN